MERREEEGDVPILSDSNINSRLSDAGRKT
jgi:hypothetical protein